MSQTVLANLPERHRLWALLGLNCGMTNADLGSLFWESDGLKIGSRVKVGDRVAEVAGLLNAQRWIITRRRVKTGDTPNTPTVTYKLWPETVSLLKSHDRRRGIVFITSTNRPMYETRFEEANDGSIDVIAKDLFGQYWGKLTPKPKISLGKFRSIASTQLKEDVVHRQFVDYFLAHAPLKVSEKNYAAEADGPFFKALEFIRSQILPATKLTIKSA